MNGYVCLLVDEIDNISTGLDKFLTFIGKTLPEKVNARMIYLFLTNRLDWESQADPRVLSFLKKTDVIFEPYDAMDLQEILNLRVEKALDKRKVGQGAIEKIAALACRETGDARKAIELLARAVRVAEEGPGRGWPAL
jgi:cell division control protein 6